MFPHHVALCVVAGSERPYARQGLQCPLRLWFGQSYGRLQILGIDDGLGGEMGQHAPDGGVPTHSGKELLCMCKLGFQLCDQLHAAARCELTGLGEHADKRRGVTFTKCGKRCEVLVGFVQQTRGYRRHNMACESFVAQDGVDQRAPGTSVAIREWVNRLELGMSQGALQKRRDVVPLQEQHQIGHACVDQLRLWTHERCAAQRV